MCRPASTASVPAAGAKVDVFSVCRWAYLNDAPVVRQSRVCIEVFLHVQVKVLKHKVQPVLAVHHVSQAVAGGTSVSRHARVGAGHPGRAGCCLALSTRPTHHARAAAACATPPTSCSYLPTLACRDVSHGQNNANGAGHCYRHLHPTAPFLHRTHRRIKTGDQTHRTMFTW